ADLAARPAAADEERAGARADVALDQVVIHVGPLRAVGVQGVAAAAGHDAVADGLEAFLVLGVDGVAVAAVHGRPAVVVNDAAVDLAVAGAAPEADPLAAAVDDEVEVLALLAAIHVQAAPGALEVLGVRAGAYRLGRLRLGDDDLQAPDPDVGRRFVDRE